MRKKFLLVTLALFFFFLGIFISINKLFPFNHFLYLKNHSYKIFEAKGDFSLFDEISRYAFNKKLINEKYLINTNGIITFSDTSSNQNKYPLNRYFDIYVGIVSGKESVFKNTDQ